MMLKKTRTKKLVRIDKLYKMVGCSLIYRQIIKPDDNEQAQNLITSRGRNTIS
jgi:hypothetical protein